MKQFLAALALTLTVAGPALADEVPMDPLYRVDETDVLNDLKAHAWNYANKAKGEWSYAEKCFNLINRARQSGIKGSAEFRHRDLKAIPGARYDEDRDEYVATLDQGEQLCVAIAREWEGPLALERLKDLAAQNQAFVSDASTNWVEPDTAATRCDEEVERMQASHADKRLSAKIGDQTVSITNAKETVCRAFRVTVEKRKEAQARADAAAEAQAAAEQAVLDAAKKKAHDELVAELRKLGATGDKLEYMVGWEKGDMRGPGGRFLTWKQQIAAPVLFSSWTSGDDGLIHVDKYVFRGGKLVSQTTMTKSKYLIGIDDSRLYR
ncbi:MAG TPA: hypothetical protein VGM90_18805 [Kofleriaceae bacterium]|jgi:uncharacterized protein YdaT